MTPKELREYYVSDKFKNEYIYEKYDLGITYSKEKTIFKIWSPTADKVILRTYSKGSDKEEESKKLSTYTMDKSTNGVWKKEVNCDLNGVYYDFTVEVDGKINETADPYAIAAGVNGTRSMVVDMESTNPKGWDNDGMRDIKVKCPIIYELHIKDFSFDKCSGISEEHRGKYLAFTEKGTTLNNDGHHVTGIDYLKSLGITHVHLLPTYDYGSVDESDSDEQFNWGYDPVNYNVPEGSYSTNAFDGKTRINEFKKMVMALHEAGIKVVMDVVYNHMYSAEDSWFQKTVPYYYFRQNEDGTFTNGSACDNDTASERAMFSNYMKQSILHWANEYHIDGFRFDLMGLHDVDTMNEIRSELDALPNGKNIIMYGEPWRADESPMQDGKIPALKSNIDKLSNDIAIFSDSTRDAIKGHVFYGEIPGFVNGGENFEDEVKSSICGWYGCSKEWKPKSPKQIISYVSAHDNFTLWDKFIESMRKEKDYQLKDEELIAVNKLTASIVCTCQGTVFFQAGEEFARTKQGEENSYNLSPKLNMLDWNRAYEYEDLVSYYKGLINIRKNFTAFYSGEVDNVKRIKFVKCKEKGIVAYKLKNSEGSNDEYKEVFVAYNSNKKNIKLQIPKGKWLMLSNKESSSVDERIYCTDQVVVESQSAIILGR